MTFNSIQTENVVNASDILGKKEKEKVQYQTGKNEAQN